MPFSMPGAVDLHYGMRMFDALMYEQAEPELERARRITFSRTMLVFCPGIACLVELFIW